MIVIDIGCAARERDNGTLEESIPRLLERFQPRLLYGFDPGASKMLVSKQDCQIIIEPTAAWIYDGFIGYTEAGILSRTGEMEGPAAVPCFDLAAWIEEIADSAGKEEIVLKMDAEGAEFELLPHLHTRKVDARLALLLIEWHLAPLFLPFRCPIELW